ncbi:MAG: hypothetical protein ACRDSO_08445 [Pseudonocardiaceae bacterium]
MAARGSTNSARRIDISPPADLDVLRRLPCVFNPYPIGSDLL